MNLLSARPRDLRYLFLDLNSYFASVEQQEHAELRGVPVAVVPVMADTSFVIAASYEAKAFGVKTGTKIGDARRMCPDIRLVKGNHTTYAAYHNRIIEVLENVLPVEEVYSIDEMRFRLLGEERTVARSTQIGQAMKQALWDRVGVAINCSIGIASNPYMAKIGTELEKPNGLQVILASELPEKVLRLKLTDFTGINKRMMARLNGAGIFTTEDMYKASAHELRAAFGSIIGERWWYLIRGYDIDSEPTNTKSLGHSHVLPPSLRHDEGVKQVLLRLLHKAAARLRSKGWVSSEMVVSIKGFESSWKHHFKFEPTQDSTFLTAEVLKVWGQRDFKRPRQVAITFYSLAKPSTVTPNLFAEETRDRTNLSHALDQINQKFGKNSIYLAGLHEAKNTAPERIAFNKTWLFSEGKDDNDWSKFRFPGVDIAD